MLRFKTIIVPLKDKNDVSYRQISFAFPLERDARDREFVFSVCWAAAVKGSSCIK